MDTEQYEWHPREFALELVDEGLVDTRKLLIACLNFMSRQEVCDMLDAEELSPRHMGWDEEDDDE